MTIHGQFKDYKDNTIDVLIYKSGDITTYAIDDYLDDTHHFCFNGSDPVVISHNCEDLFTPIISSTCTIKIVANIWCGDILFSNGIGEIIARVTRTIGNDTELLFVGYVTPLTFSQDINKQHNEIDIVCNDILGCLEDKTLSTGSTYENTLANAAFSSFKQILNRIGLYNNVSPSTYTFPNEQYNTQLYVDTSIVDFLDLLISDNLWLGEGKDDEMSLYDILLEVLKYTNSRIVSVDGQTIYMIDNSSETNRNRMFFLNTNAYVDFPLMLDVLPQDDIANEQVTIDDCFNIIGVKCDLENLDDVIVSPLSKENYIKPYTNKQLYMSEYACENTDAVYGSKYYDNWLDMIITDAPVYYNNITDYSKLWMKHWYIRFCKPKGWEIYDEFIPPKDSNGNLIKQYIVGGRMNDLFNRSEIIYVPVDYDVYDYAYTISYDTPFYCHPAFVEIGHSGNKMTAINPEEGEIKMEPHLIIPCPETWRYVDSETYREVTEEWAFNYINKELAKYENNPLIKYKSNTTVNYTPGSDDVTNYLIFSGELQLIPSCLYETQWLPQFDFTKRGLSMSNSFQEFIWGEYEYDSSPSEYYHGPSRSYVAGPGKDDTRWYARMYWTKENPNQQTAYHTHAADEHQITPEHAQQFHTAQEPGSPTYKEGELYSMSTEGMYGKLFGWGNTQIDKRNTTVINIGYVPILMCKLRIGDKWLNEIQVEGQELPSWEWTTDSSAVFSLGVKPKRPDNLGDEPTDYLIGQKYDIINTVTDAMNIQGNPKGMAIPIRYSDKIQGDMEFQIVGPYNAVLTSVNHYYRHGTLFRSEKSWSELNADMCVLNHTHAIDITNFEMKPYSDNAKNDTSNDGDLHYYSEDNKKYNNPKDDIEFKIVTALKPDEAAELDVATGISYNNPTDVNGDLYLPETKPEEIYIQTMYDLYSTPKKIVEYEATLDDNKLSEMYRTVYENDLMEHLDVHDFKSIVIGDELDLKQNRMKIKTREI